MPCAGVTGCTCEQEHLVTTWGGHGSNPGRRIGLCRPAVRERGQAAVGRWDLMEADPTGFGDRWGRRIPFPEQRTVLEGDKVGDKEDSVRSDTTGVPKEVPVRLSKPGQGRQPLPGQLGPGS